MRNGTEKVILKLNEGVSISNCPGVLNTPGHCNVIKLRRNPSKKRYNIEYFMVLTSKIIGTGLATTGLISLGSVAKIYSNPATERASLKSDPFFWRSPPLKGRGTKTKKKMAGVL